LERGPEQPQQPVEYISHDEFARRRALRLIRQNPPPTRDPIEAEPVIPDPVRDEQKAKLLRRLSPFVDLNGPDGNAHLHRAIGRAREDSAENALLVAAAVSFFIPFGFMLALWPAISSKGTARTVAIISILMSFVMLVFFWRPIYFVIIK